MRYQQLIYIQNAHHGVRNRDLLNVNMSSDICVFNAPQFTISGASKIDCDGFTGTSYVITTATTIPLTFNFTGNTDSFTGNNTTFKYEIYKYSNNNLAFLLPPVYKSDNIDYSSFSGSNITIQNIPVSGLSLDGEYLVKGYYNLPVCTEFLNKLGKTIDTSVFKNGQQYNLYNKDLDFYFIAINSAEKPSIINNGENFLIPGQLTQQVIIPQSGQTEFVIGSPYFSDFIVTLNGLTLAPELDYTFTGNVITLSGETYQDDIVTVIYTNSTTGKFVHDIINVTTTVVSGTTDNEGTNDTYFNTTTGKYEIYTSVKPFLANTIIVMINGVTLANNVDYYQSITNPKRIILNGDVMVGDIITIVYFPYMNIVNDLLTNNPTVSWQINTPPQTTAGTFTLQVSTTQNFNTLYSTGNTQYIVGTTLYSDSFVASGEVGTKLYYRVKNTKNYETICGDILTSIEYSDTIPITIASNSINSY
jgi:hypothetical protein